MLVDTNALLRTLPRMKILKTSLAAISTVLALHSIYGALLEITACGRKLPMLRPQAFLDRQVQGNLFDHTVCAVLFSIYPLWFIVSRSRHRKTDLAAATQ